MSNDRVTFWRSIDDGPWEQIEVGIRSLVAWQLGQIEVGGIYDDGYGNRYRLKVES